MSASTAFFITHAVAPLLAFCAVVAYLNGAHGDFTVADALYRLEGSGWSLKNGLLTETILHKGGRGLSVLASLLVVFAWARSWKNPELATWRRPLGYLLAATLSAMALVSLIKHESGMDCPWDLVRYGGDRIFIGLLEMRPHSMPRAGCFPAGHASGGFAWVALYFFCRAAAPRWRYRALAGALVVGTAFGMAQQLRGAHFLSHDAWTLAICWFVSLVLYLLMLRPERSRSSIWNPVSGQRGEPLDVANEIPSTAAAAKHAQTVWMRTEVAKSIDKIERGDAQWIDHGPLWDKLAANALKRVAEHDGGRATPVRPHKA